MQKRANLACADRLRGRVKNAFLLMVGLALAGSAAGGMTVGTVRTSYGEVTAKVETSIARQGPKGTAAEFSTPRRAGEVHWQDPEDGL